MDASGGLQVMGDHLKHFPANKPASIDIAAPGRSKSDLAVDVVGQYPIHFSRTRAFAWICTCVFKCVLCLYLVLIWNDSDITIPWLLGLIGYDYVSDLMEKLLLIKRLNEYRYQIPC